MSMLDEIRVKRDEIYAIARRRKAEGLWMVATSYAAVYAVAMVAGDRRRRTEDRGEKTDDDFHGDIPRQGRRVTASAAEAMPQGS